MLAANEAVASHLTEHKVGFLRRGHADPEPRKLRSSPSSPGASASRSRTPRAGSSSSASWPRRPTSPRRTPSTSACSGASSRRSTRPSPRGITPWPARTTATSPRRSAAIPTSRSTASSPRCWPARSPRADFDELAALAEHCTRTERRAETAERELIKIKLLTYLAGHIGETFHAVIVGVEDFGFFCRLVEFPAEGLVHVTGLADDYYYLEGGTHTLIGRRGGKRYRLGDRVEVTVARVDVDRRELDLTLGDARAAQPTSPAAPRRPREPRSRPSARTRPPDKAGDQGQEEGKAADPK